MRIEIYYCDMCGKKVADRQRIVISAKPQAVQTVDTGAQRFDVCTVCYPKLQEIFGKAMRTVKEEEE